MSIVRVPSAFDYSLARRSHCESEATQEAMLTMPTVLERLADFSATLWGEELPGDVIHAAEHVANPEWDHVHDSEPEVALRTRLAVLEEFVDAPACASHISGWGSVRREGDGLAWVPL